MLSPQQIQSKPKERVTHGGPLSSARHTHCHKICTAPDGYKNRYPTCTAPFSLFSNEETWHPCQNKSPGSSWYMTIHSTRRISVRYVRRVKCIILESEIGTSSYTGFQHSQGDETVPIIVILQTVSHPGLLKPVTMNSRPKAPTAPR